MNRHYHILVKPGLGNSWEARFERTPNVSALGPSPEEAARQLLRVFRELALDESTLAREANDSHDAVVFHVGG